MGAAAYFGGDSSSETRNSTEIKDMRVVGGEASNNVSADGGSSVSVVSTDHGAVAGGFQLGHKAIDASVRNAEGLQKTLTTLYGGALTAVKDSQAAVTSMSSKVAGDLATAFTDSKAPDKSILIVGGLVVVGLAGVMVFAMKSKG